MAGRRRFDDYWARDSFFASFGSLSLGDLGQAKTNLELFLMYMKEDGQLPRRINRDYVGLKYIGLRKSRKRLVPNYKTALFTSPSSDQNSLFILSLAKYLQKSLDYSFFEQNYSKIKRVMDWNFTLDKDHDGLLEEGFLANWEDTILKRGKVLYTNVLHYAALRDFAYLSSAHSREFDRYRKKADEAKNRINDVFWNGSFFEGWGSRRGVFNTDGNLLSIVFNLASHKQAKAIGEYMDYNFLNQCPMKSSFPSYPSWMILPTQIFKGTSHYHNGFGWLWLGCLDAIAKNKAGMEEKAKEAIELIAKQIIKDKGVYEVFDEDRPLETRFYKCEVPFAWSAGLFLLAVNEVFQ